MINFKKIKENIPSNFRFFAIKLIKLYLSRKYKVVLKKNVLVNFDTFLEGKNVINENVDIRNSYIGLGTYIAPNSDLTYTKIGRFCSIGSNVRTCFGIHPIRNFVSTHPSFFSLKRQAGFSFVQKQLFQEHKFVSQDKVVEIGNDVWIGDNAAIFDGIVIGDGAVIGMGSIVTKSVEPYSINVGVPAKKIGYRFDKKYIEFLLKFKWWNKDFKWIKDNAVLFSDIKKFYQRYKNET